MSNAIEIELPGLDCGLCGYPSCSAMAAQLDANPALIKRCIPRSADSLGIAAAPAPPPILQNLAVETDEHIAACNSSVPGSCSVCQPEAQSAPVDLARATTSVAASEWHDVLGREFDFVLEHFPEESGPREQVIPHNPMLTRELAIEPGEVLIGRPLGISCGCPVTHCGIVQSVDEKTGTLVWCVTGPLHPRQHGFKDIGYYSAQAYEGLISKAKVPIEIGRRYWFQPRMCMMQWRHSGLVNFVNRSDDGLQVRIEGLWIG